MTHEVFLHIDEIVLEGMASPSDFESQLERELQRILGSTEVFGRLADGAASPRFSIGHLDAGELRLGSMSLGASLGQALAAQVLATVSTVQPTSGVLAAASAGRPLGLETGSFGKEKA